MKSFFTRSLSLSDSAIPSSLINEITLENTVGLYLLDAARGLHLRESSFKEGQFYLRCSTYVIPEIQLLVRLSCCKFYLFSRPSIFRIKLWLRSSLLSSLHSLRPSIASISLNERMSVLRLTSFSRACIFLIRLLNKFKYATFERSSSQDIFYTICSVMSSILERIGISGGIEFSIAV